MGKDGFGADFQFALFDGPEEYQYGLVNVAAFLAMGQCRGLARGHLRRAQLAAGSR